MSWDGDTTWSLVFLWIAGLLALAVGVLAVQAPLFASFAVFTVCMVWCLALLREHPINQLLPAAMIVVSAFVGLPQRLRVGPISGLAIVTIIFVVAAIPFVLSHLEALRAVPLGILAYGGYLIVSMIFATPTHDGIQDILIQIMFVFLIALSAAASRQSSHLTSRIISLVPIAGVTAAILGTILVMAGKAGVANSSNVGLSARPFAIFEVIILAWALANLRMRGHGILLACVALGLVVFTLSRSALAASAVMFSFNWLNLASLSAWLRTALAIVLVVVVGVFAVHNIPSLHDRFYRGDVTSVGGLRVNAEGRSVLWRSVWKRYLTAPILGHGAGDSTATVAKIAPTAGQPHNDYLRILDDTGLIGLILWGWGYVALLRRTALARRVAFSADDRAVAQAGFLGLLGIAILMIFDNPLVYTFAVGPLAVLVGSAIGTLYRTREEQSKGRPSMSSSRSTARLRLDQEFW